MDIIKGAVGQHRSDGKEHISQSLFFSLNLYICLHFSLPLCTAINTSDPTLTIPTFTFTPLTHPACTFPHYLEKQHIPSILLPESLETLIHRCRCACIGQSLTIPSWWRSVSGGLEIVTFIRTSSNYRTPCIHRQEYKTFWKGLSADWATCSDLCIPSFSIGCSVWTVQRGWMKVF